MISASAQSVYDAARALPPEDLADLIDALIISAHEDPNGPFSNEWREEIRRRAAEVEAGTAVLASWEDVKREARESTDD